MAYDEVLAERVRDVVAARAPLDEMRMFGGLAFMVNTHMACGLVGPDLMVRVGADNYDEALALGAEEMDFTGRPMRGMVMIRASDLETDEALEEWVERAVAYAQSEPPRPRKKPRAPSAP
jgi:TfoX/Sxy family transcriptional regulator of competence genes